MLATQAMIIMLACKRLADGVGPPDLVAGTRLRTPTYGIPLKAGPS